MGIQNFCWWALFLSLFRDILYRICKVFFTIGLDSACFAPPGQAFDVPPWLLSCFIYLFNESDIDIKVVGCGSVNLVEIITTILS